MAITPETGSVSTTVKGSALERRVAEIYRHLGAETVQTNLRLAGQELDVLAVMPGVDGFANRVWIDCKNYKAKLGVNALNESARKLALLRQAGEIDLPVIVSNVGFTPEAVTAARSLGVRVATLPDLLRRLADFSGYLDRAAAEYEHSRIHAGGLYRALQCTSDDGLGLGDFREYSDRWFASGGQLITLLGDYGTGKTTSAQRLFWESARGYLKDPESNRIPIFIPLKRYRKEVNLRSLITDLLLHEYGVRIPDFRTFTSLNSEGRLLLILDAFDEMASGADEGEVISIFREILALVTPKSRVLLTCRTHFFKDQDQINRIHAGTALYKEMDVGSVKYSLCYISPFDRDDVELLVRRYSPERGDEYLNLIDTTYNLRELARHPILLDMILTTVPEVLRGTKLVTAADLYTAYTSFWLDRDDWRTRMTHEQREFFMKELALHFQIERRTSIHFRDLPKYIKQRFPGLRTFRELDYFEADVRTCTFLVRDKGGHYSFVHRSFSEFFAAAAILEHVLDGKWPDHLFPVRGGVATEWITPEVGGFFSDLVDKKSALNTLTSHFFADKLDGAIIVVILALFRNSKRVEHRQLFDLAYSLYDAKALAGVSYRWQITELAEKHKTKAWRVTRAQLTTWGDGPGSSRFRVFTGRQAAILERIRAELSAEEPD
jgi:hypothetical protein